MRHRKNAGGRQRYGNMHPLFKEILRKLIHVAVLGLIFGYTYLTIHFSSKIGILALTALLMVFLELEYIRLDYRPRFTRKFAKMVESLLLRKREKNHLIGSIYIITSTIITFAAFDYPIAFLALLLMVFGDMASALFGMAFGGPRIFRKKTWIGGFAGLCTNMMVGFFVFHEFPILFIPMAITASVIETLTQKIDDNLTVPIFAGFIGQMLVYFLDIPLPSLFNIF